MIFFLLLAFFLNIIPVYAQSTQLVLPAPGQMIRLSKPFAPLGLQGLKVDPKDPMRFDFILRQGQNKSSSALMQEEGMNLVRYFLAALTLPEKDVWVNLSPFEHDRIISQELSLTRMGRDMLAQDYILKQMTASLLYPNDGLGHAFWKKVYSQAKSGLAGAQIPVSSFNKVWILPDKADVFIKGNTVIITNAHLKVMLDHDYYAAQHVQGNERIHFGQQEIAQRAMRELIVPVLENEINQGEHFSPLRQIFQAAILAEWYKRHFRQGILGREYTDQHKVSGIDETPAQFKEDLYQRYLQAYKKGVYNFIKDDTDPMTGEAIPRKYFSGGLNVSVGPVYREMDAAQSGEQQQGFVPAFDDLIDLQVAMDPLGANIVETAAGSFINNLENPYWTQVRASFDHVFASTSNSIHLEKTRKKLLTQNVRVTSGWIDLEHGVEFFAVRVANDSTMGTPKGGIRWTKASELLKDVEFLHQWNNFLKLNPTKNEAKAFIAKWLTQEANSLAIGMTLKTAGLANRLGGAKGDVFLGQIVDNAGKWELKDIPAEMSSAVARAHARQLVNAQAVGMNIDSPAPDVNTNPQIMAWYADEMIRAQHEASENIFFAEVDRKDMGAFKSEYRKLFDRLSAIVPDGKKTPYLNAVYQFWQKHIQQGIHIPVPWLGVFTGLAVDKGGVAGRASATGEGVVAITKAYYQSNGQDHHQKTVAVQGFGNVGSFTAIAAAREGFNVRVINDKGITLIKESGFSEQELIKISDEMAKNKTLLALWKNSFIEHQGVIGIINDGNDPVMARDVSKAVLGARVDVLIPAALQLQVSMANVDEVRVKLVVEAANNPVYPDALKALHQRGIDVIPGILANAGGVFVSGLQMEQAATGRVLTQEEVTSRMTTALGNALAKLLIWNKTSYHGALSEAYVHYVMTRLWSRNVLPVVASITPVVVIKRDALAKKFPQGGDIYDGLVGQGYIEPIEREPGSATFHTTSVLRVLEGVAKSAKYNFKEVMRFILGVEVSKVIAGDPAMTNGGIDMDTTTMKINEQGTPVHFELTNATRSIANIHGLVPVFIQMHLITMPALLGALL